MADDRRDRFMREEIERRAYERFCDRGYQGGADLDDWLAAEREILQAAKDAIEPEHPPRAEVDPKPRRRPAARS